MYKFDRLKNEVLKQKRGVNFEDLIYIIETGGLLDILNNPNYPGQGILVVKFQGYIWGIPFVKKDNFLKTAYKSRKFQKKYGGQ